MALLGDEAVRYDGAVDEDGRLAARRRFQDGDARWFVGNPACAGTGLTLTAAATVVYYSNSFNLEHRLQSEDRAHRIGQRNAVRYVDLVAKGTVDSKIVAALRDKLDVASQITGDAARAWL
jgi:SNF2 family DNA or RNA helicase